MELERGQQPKKFTTYERDGNGGDEAMFRWYEQWHRDAFTIGKNGAINAGAIQIGNTRLFNRPF